jgi:hypothetical protein
MVESSEVYLRGARKGMLKIPAIKRLVRQHNKASQIKGIANIKDYDTLIKRLAQNGYRVDHEKQMLIQTRGQKYFPVKAEKALKTLKARQVVKPATAEEIVRQRQRRRVFREQGDIDKEIDRLMATSERVERRNKFLKEINTEAERKRKDRRKRFLKEGQPFRSTG